MESVVTSRSFVGSSSSSTFGAAIRTDSRYSLRRSPPERRPIVVCCRSGVNKKRSSIVLAEKVPSSVFTCAATSWMQSYTRWFRSSSRPSCEKCPMRTVSPSSTVPLSG